jgi:hypothetical protein
MAADNQSKTTETSNLGEIFYRVFSGGLRIRLQSGVKQGVQFKLLKAQ